MKMFSLRKLGFTMIELLIVIAVLGILAVAVLAAINPIEQINRGKDTGSRTDAEQLLSAVDRYYATKGYYPWVSSANTVADGQAWLKLSTLASWKDDTAGTALNVLDKLSGTGAAGTGELKTSFVERIVASEYNSLYVYREAGIGSSTYVCFSGKSQSFQTEAKERCLGTTGSIPSDMEAATRAHICGASNAGSDLTGLTGKFLTCLP